MRLFVRGTYRRTSHQSGNTVPSEELAHTLGRLEQGRERVDRDLLGDLGANLALHAQTWSACNYELVVEMRTLQSRTVLSAFCETGCSDKTRLIVCWNLSRLLSECARSSGVSTTVA